MPDTITPNQYEQAYISGFRRTAATLSKLGADDSRAEEVAQGAWTQGWAQRHQLRDPDRVVEWVNSIAIHRFRSDAAKSRRMVPFSAAGFQPKIAPTVNPVVIGLRNALKQLPERHRAIVEAVYLEGYASAEVAISLGISKNALHQRLTRTRHALRAMLAA
jgi:DNA-directed RNA polymerase specialized sigma24 family protein